MFALSRISVGFAIALVVDTELITCNHSFITRDVKVSRLPGWEKNSWGYHGESGTICSGDKNGLPFGTTFGGTQRQFSNNRADLQPCLSLVGDIIGCGIDFTQNKMFYTKNGSLLGMPQLNPAAVMINRYS